MSPTCSGKTGPVRPARRCAPGEYTELSAGEAKVKLRMEAEEATSHLINGQSGRADFSPGLTFDLVGHDRAEFNDTYVITSIQHVATQGYGETTR